MTNKPQKQPQKSGETYKTKEKTKDNKNKQVSKQKIEKYRSLSSKALEIAKKNIAKGKKDPASEIIEIVSCYLSDSKHFQDKGDFVNSLSCLNYAHGWLDCGARLKIFNVKNNKLFTI
jgi:hypothetical protein